MMAGSEQVDIALVWGTMVSSCVAKGALLPLDDLLDEYGTDIQECLGDYLQAGKVSGVAYQVPVNRSLFYQGGIVVRTDILESTGSILLRSKLPMIWMGCSRPFMRASRIWP